MKNMKFKWLIILIVLISVSISFVPEPSAKSLVKSNWNLPLENSHKVILKQVGKESLFIRNSIVNSQDGILYRSWGPNDGIIPINMYLPLPNINGKILSIPVTGTTRAPIENDFVSLVCEKDGNAIEIFKGSVNTTFQESIIQVPPNFCLDGAEVQFKSNGAYNIGLGSIFEISYLSFLKKSFIGMLPYFLISLLVLSIYILVGAAYAYKHFDGQNSHLFLFGMISIGLISLSVFYLSSFFRIMPLVFLLFALVYLYTQKQNIKFIYEELSPYLFIWILLSFFYFTLLFAGTNGLGHWEPNFRFWPATRSSDNELPWLFAELIKSKANLYELFINQGGWRPTDRTPLLTGTHLLLTDIFRFMQISNDGRYLSGIAYNILAIVINTLWAPASLYFLKSSFNLSFKQSIQIILLIAFIPFVLFNSIYGWPKVFGATFGLIAIVVLLKYKVLSYSSILFSFLISFSILAHASNAFFMLPVFIVFIYKLKNVKRIIYTTCLILFMLATWSVYKHYILPSDDPLLKFALTGNFGFANPKNGLWMMLYETYTNLTFNQWLEQKIHLFSQLFIHAEEYSVFDFGADKFLNKSRIMDVLHLFSGNIVVIIAALVALICLIKNFFQQPMSLGDFSNDKISLNLVFPSSLFTIVLYFLIFMAPFEIPHLPYNMLFALTLASFTYMFKTYFLILKYIIAPFIFIYSSIVWGIIPLLNCLHLDYLALIMLLLVYSYIWIFILDIKYIYSGLIRFRN